MKKLVSLILIISILTSPCLALGSIDADSNVELVNEIGLTEAQMADIAVSLQAVEQDKINFGMEDVDFSSLMLGNEILAYEYTVDGLERLDFSYIPVFSGDTIVALVVKNGIGPEAITKQIGTALVPELNVAAKRNNQVSIIYDADGCYLYDSNELKMVKESRHETSLRSSMPELFLDSLDASSMSVAACVPRLAVKTVQTRTTTENGTYIINMTFVSQESNRYANLCWAASMAMVGGYNTGISKTIVEIATTVYGPSNYQRGAGITTIMNAYDTIYSMNVIGETTPSNIDEAWVGAYIWDDKPLHAGFINMNLDNQYHAVVLYGIAGNGSTIMIRDPDEGSFYGYYDTTADRIAYITYYDGYEMFLDYALYY